MIVYRVRTSDTGAHIIHRKARFEIVWQRRGMIVGAGMQPESLRPVAERLVDHPLQEVFPQSPADKLRDEPELHELDFASLASIQFGEPGLSIPHEQDMDFDSGVADNAGQFGVRKLLAARPIPSAADCIVDLSVELDGRLRHMTNADTAQRRRDRPALVRQHLDVSGRDGHGQFSICNNLARRAGSPYLETSDDSLA